MLLRMIQNEIELDIRELVAQLNVHLTHRELALINHGSNDIQT